MTNRYPVSPAPGPLENYAESFDDLFGARAQRRAFRRYLEGLLLPAERNKTLTALANTEPVVGAQRKEAQSLQWFLSESRWDPKEINRRRVELLLEDPATAPNDRGALVIDETGDRKEGKKTAHVGRQYLSSIGKIDNGVVYGPMSESTTPWRSSPTPLRITSKAVKKIPVSAPSLR
jgi:SRSO17 transposase